MSTGDEKFFPPVGGPAEEAYSPEHRNRKATGDALRHHEAEKCSVCVLSVVGVLVEPVVHESCRASAAFESVVDDGKTRNRVQVSLESGWDGPTVDPERREEFPLTSGRW